MAKNPSDKRDLLMFKLGSLDQYILHNKRKLKKFSMEILKANLVPTTQGFAGLVDGVLVALLDLYTADRPPSEIEDDLAGARAEVNAEYNATPDWARIEPVVPRGPSGGSIENGFDSVLSYNMGQIIEGLNKLREQSASTEDHDGLPRELSDLMDAARSVFEEALKPAQRLRERWLNALSAPTTIPTRKLRGRPKDEQVAKRNKKMYEAWITERYLTYGELGREFRVSEDVARKAVKSLQRQQPSQSRNPKRGRSSE